MVLGVHAVHVKIFSKCFVLKNWQESVKNVCWSGQDWSKVSADVGKIGQECLEKKKCSIGQDCLHEWAGFVKSIC